MNRLLTTAAMALMCCLGSYAANTTDDVITLKNGDRITGDIIEYSTGNSARIRLQDGQELTISYDRISSISTNSNAEPEDAEPQREMVARRGLSFGAGLEVFTGGVATWGGVHLQAGWRFRPGLFLGVGVMPCSVSSNNKECDPFLFDSNFFGMPIYAQWKQDFVHRKASPFLQARYGVMITDDRWNKYSNTSKISKGYYLSLGAGCRVAFKHLPIALSPHLGFSACGVKSLIEDDTCDVREPAGFTFGATIEF